MHFSFPQAHRKPFGWKATTAEVVVTTPVESRIMSIRGNQIMIDRDLTELYRVETKRLNEAVKSNIELLILEIRINPYTKDFTQIEKTLQEYDRLGITIY